MFSTHPWGESGYNPQPSVSFKIIGMQDVDKIKRLTTYGITELPMRTVPSVCNLSNGFNAVPVANRTEEFAFKQDVEKHLPGFQHEAYYREKRKSSNTPEKDVFGTLNTGMSISTLTSPVGHLTQVDIFFKSAVITFLNLI